MTATSRRARDAPTGINVRLRRTKRKGLSDKAAMCRIPNKGLGLCCTEVIRRGEPVFWMVKPELVKRKASGKLPKNASNDDHAWHGFEDQRKGYLPQDAKVLDGPREAWFDRSWTGRNKVPLWYRSNHPSWNGKKFCPPNTQLHGKRDVPRGVAPKSKACWYATREIQVGEEIVWSYGVADAMWRTGAMRCDATYEPIRGRWPTSL